MFYIAYLQVKRTAHVQHCLPAGEVHCACLHGLPAAGVHRACPTLLTCGWRALGMNYIAHLQLACTGHELHCSPAADVHCMSYIACLQVKCTAHDLHCSPAADVHCACSTSLTCS